MDPVTTQFAALLDRAQGGDPAATEALLVPHLPALNAVVRLRAGSLKKREAHEDLVQSVCRQVIAGLDAFRGHAPAAFAKWVQAAALNKIAERHAYYRAQKRDTAREVPLAFESRVDEDVLLGSYRAFFTPSRDAAAREEVARLEKAFAELPETYRDVLLMTRLTGVSTAEIAERLGKSQAAVRQLLCRARAKLGRLLR